LTEVTLTDCNHIRRFLFSNQLVHEESVSFFLLEFPASLKIVAKKGGWLIDRYHQQTHRKKKENRMTSWYIHSAGECYPHLFAINHGNSTSNNIPRIYMQRDANTTVSEIIENLL